MIKTTRCECLGNSYFGRHCENTTTKIVIYEMVSTSVTHVAITFLVSMATFILVVDTLKYCFGIDPVEKERQRMQREKREKTRKPVIQRFVYINEPPTDEKCNSTTAETIV